MNAARRTVQRGGEGFPVSSEEKSQDTSNVDVDAQLMLAVQANDALAFEELMSRNQSRVYSFLLRFLGNQQLAEDLTQEVFMRVYKHRATYRQEARFSTWLFRVAHNVAFNAIRTKIRRPETLFNDVNAPNSQTTQVGYEESVLSRSGATPTQKIAKVERQEIVRAAIDSLNPRQKQAVLLSRFEGMSYQQIADVMQMTPKAVKSLLSRARMNVKDILAPYIEEGKRPE